MYWQAKPVITGRFLTHLYSFGCMQRLTRLEKKVVDFLGDKYKHVTTQYKEVNDTKRLSKTKSDIIAKIKNNIEGFMTMSDIIKVSSITPDRISQQGHNSENKKYIRELHSSLSRDLIEATVGFNLVAQPDTLEYFKEVQRDIARDIFSPTFTYMLIRAIFAFHPTGIISQNLGDHMTYSNPRELDSEHYREHHKLYYHELATILVESGLDEIKKDLHPDKDRAIINHLDLTVNMIQKLNYNVERVKPDSS